MSLINITPTMTSNTTPNPFVINCSSYLDSSDWNWGNAPYKVFDKLNETYQDSFCWARNQNSGWIGIDFGESKNITHFEVTSRNYTNANLVTPLIYKLQGSNDGTIFEDIFVSERQSDWAINETRMFYIGKVAKHRYYRVVVEEHSGLDFMSLGEINFYYDNVNDINDVMKNKFKNPIKVDGFIELNNSINIPQTPSNGDMKIFARNNKIYQMNDTGECSEIGGSNTSGGTTQMTMDILFEGMADTTGEYTMLKNIDEYNYLISSYEVKPKGLISIIPKMSSNTQGDYLASASSQQRPAYSAFNGVTGINDNVWYSSEIDPPHWVAITNSVEMTINAFSITNGDATSGYGAYAPKIFTLQGSNDGIDYVDIKTFTLTQFNASEEKIFMLDGKVSFKSYRLYITAGFSTSYKAVIVGEFKLGLLENDGFDRIINKYSYGRNIIENYNSKEYISKYDLNKLNFQTDGNAFITRVVGIK